MECSRRRGHGRPCAPRSDPGTDVPWNTWGAPREPMSRSSHPNRRSARRRSTQNGVPERAKSRRGGGVHYRRLGVARRRARRRACWFRAHVLRVTSQSGIALRDALCFTATVPVCRTCELIWRRDTGDAPPWIFPRTPGRDVVHAFGTGVGGVGPEPGRGTQLPWSPRSHSDRCPGAKAALCKQREDSVGRSSGSEEERWPVSTCRFLRT